MTNEPISKSDMAVTGLRFTPPTRQQEIGKECAELLVEARNQVAVVRRQVEIFTQQAQETSKQFEEVEKQISGFR